MHAPKCLLLLLVILLPGCGNEPRTPPQTEGDLDRRFIDKPANEFFEMYGQPAGVFARDDGSTVYRWVYQPVPGRPLFTQYDAPGGSYSVVDTYEGRAEAYDCELRIYADQDNIIRRFKVAVDTMGKWSASRCTEVL